MFSLSAAGLTCIRDDRVLFEQLSFELTSGRLLLVEGDNGTGKTTLLRILCGIRLPEQGVVSWEKTLDDIKYQTSVHSYESYAGDMVYLGHLDGNKLDLTVAENLQYARALSGKSSGKPSNTTGQVLDRVGLKYFDDQLVSNLSAGQRRRLAMGRLLLADASLWILDEPFTALDKKGIEMVEREINEQLKRGGIVIMTSHHAVTLDAEKITHLQLGI